MAAWTTDGNTRSSRRNPPALQARSWMVWSTLPSITDPKASLPTCVVFKGPGSVYVRDANLSSRLIGQFQIALPLSTVWLTQLRNLSGHQQIWSLVIAKIAFPLCWSGTSSSIVWFRLKMGDTDAKSTKPFKQRKSFGKPFDLYTISIW